MGLALLGACSGGGTPAPVKQNSEPVFTDSATIRVRENQAAVAKLNVMDADGDPLQFSITGGADQALFQITPDGSLSFRTAPDFEAPKDADGNNLYLVEVSVSDGKARVSRTFEIIVEDDVGGAVNYRLLATGLTGANNLVTIPDGSGRMFVTQKAGRIVILTPQGGGGIASTPFLDISSEVATDGERGLLGLAPSPTFQQDRMIYVFVNNLAGDIEIRRYRTMAQDRDRVDPSSAELVLKVANSSNAFVGGWIGFGPDGFLYICTGSGPLPGMGEDAGDLLGKILRIDVRTDGFPLDNQRNYSIPADNPVTAPGAAREVWIRGARHPRRASIDPATGNIWFSDYGEMVNGITQVAEFNLVRREDAGGNYSAVRIHGTGVPTPPDIPAAPPGVFYPFGILTYGQVRPIEGEIDSTAGYVYRGRSETLQGYFVGAERGRGGGLRLYAVARVRQNQPKAQDPVNRTSPQVVAFGEDADGNLYLTSRQGEVYAVVPD